MIWYLFVRLAIISYFKCLGYRYSISELTESAVLVLVVSKVMVLKMLNTIHVQFVCLFLTPVCYHFMCYCIMISDF